MSPVDLDARVAAGLAETTARLHAACAAAGRDRSEVTLVAVSKTHPVEAAAAAVAAGVLDLGENRPRELASKAAVLDDVRWHLIGPLQRNKVRDVVGVTHCIHTVDRRRLLDAIEARAQHVAQVEERDVEVDVMVQVNVAGDRAKHGCAVDEVDALVAYGASQPHVRVVGLMTMPPLPEPGVDPNEAARPHFARLRGLRDRVARGHPGVRALSMGMSADLEAAVLEGATHVRVGTAIFGGRPPRRD